MARQNPPSKAAKTLLKLVEIAKQSPGQGPRDLSINHDYYLHGGKKNLLVFETDEEEAVYWQEQDPETYETLDVPVDDETLKKLEEIAKTEGYNLASIIRLAINEGLEKAKQN